MEWLNGKCERAKKIRNETWKRMEEKPIQRTESYRQSKNEYVRVRREEDKRYENNIFDYC